MSILLFLSVRTSVKPVCIAAFSPFLIAIALATKIDDVSNYNKYVDLFPVQYDWKQWILWEDSIQ